MRGGIRPGPASLPLRPRLHVRVGCEFAFEASAPTPLIVQILPHRADPHTVVWERRRFEPAVRTREYLDGFGNRCLRLTVPEGGHSTYWERPDLFNRAVLDFVGRHSK